MKNIAIVGVSGLVGSKLIDVLNNNNIQANYLLFGHNSAGSTVRINNRQLKVLDIESIYSYKLNYALFMTSEGVSQKYIPKLAQSGTICIDNSQHYRLVDNVPLIVPCINIDKASTNSNIIANPNCTTIQLAIVLNALKSLKIRRVVASTYQSVSGAGKTALEELFNKSDTFCDFDYPIHNNIIPLIGTADNTGVSTEEHKVINECRKILDMHELSISCVAVRVPVPYCHCISVNIELENQFDKNTIIQLLSNQKDIVIIDDNTTKTYAMPVLAQNTPEVYVGRIHIDPSNEHCLNCFIVADNLLRGASYNAYEILTHIIRRKDGNNNCTNHAIL